MSSACTSPDAYCTSTLSVTTKQKPVACNVLYLYMHTCTFLKKKFILGGRGGDLNDAKHGRVCTVGSASHAIHGASKHTVCSSVVLANDHACRCSVYMYTCND